VIGIFSSALLTALADPAMSAPLKTRAVQSVTKYRVFMIYFLAET
jgi:hypothetical protein